MPKSHKPHRCPRCQQHTTEKFYCIPCRDYLKKPPALEKRKIIYYWEGTKRRGE